MCQERVCERGEDLEPGVGEGGAVGLTDRMYSYMCMRDIQAAARNMG